MRNRKIQMIIIAVFLISVFVVGFIVKKSGKQTEPATDAITDIELTADVTTNVKVLEIPTNTKNSSNRVEPTDPRVSVDASGGVHIDVGGTDDNGHTDEPHISGDVFVIPDIKGDDE